MTRVLFATAELAPLARVGGLGEACAGLVRELRAQGVEVDVAIPDYEGLPLTDEVQIDLDVPAWAAPARARSGHAAAFGRVTLIDAPGLAKPHPYNNPLSNASWPDNAARFFGFSAAIAALAGKTRPDLLHLNDWHTAPALGFARPQVPSVLTVHNLAYQGAAELTWLARLEVSAAAFEKARRCNPLAGGVALADRIVAVSPTYAREILRPPEGAGLDSLLQARGAALTGILNGINTASWDPSLDPDIEANYDADRLEGKTGCQAALLAELGWEPGLPLVAMVTRLTAQKGIDFALEAVPELARIGARLVLLGSGEPALAAEARALASEYPNTLRFTEDFDESLSHRIFSGSDLLLMPSRFEPCGLTQMQAMAYGTIPVVTPVGGLRDTVRDADAAPEGNGFVADAVGTPSVLLALRRAVGAWTDPARRRALQERGMRQDWSWRVPAERYRALYDEMLLAS